MKNRSSRYLLTAILVAGTPMAFGLPFEWDGSLSSDNWNASSSFPNPLDTNWDLPIGTPGSEDTVSFGQDAADFIVDLNGNRVVRSVSFSGTNGYTLNNNTLTLLTGDISVGSGSVTHTINSNVVNVGFTDWSVGNNATLEVSGVVSGFGIVKNGNGTLRLLGENIYGNGTVINAGTLAIQTARSVGDPAQTVGVSMNGGDLRALADLTFENHTLLVIDGRLDARGDAGTDGADLTISGTTSLDVRADGVVTLSGGRGLEDATAGRDGGSFEVAGGTFDLQFGGGLVSRGGEGEFSPPPGRTRGPNGRSGSVAFSGGVSNLAGTVDLSGFDAGINFVAREGGGLSISGGAQVGITGTIDLSGGGGAGVAGADGGDFNVAGGTLTIGGGALIDLSGGENTIGSEPNGNAGVLSLTGGTTTIESAAIVRGSSGSASNVTDVSLVGARVDVAGGDLFVQNDVLALTDGAVLSLSAGSINALQVRIEDGSLNFTGGKLATRQVNGDLLQQGGTLAAGDSPGLTIVTGSYGHAAGDLEVELGGTTPGRDFDLYQINGDVDLTGGSLDVVLIDPFVPVIDSEFVFLTVGGTLTGTFDGLGQGARVGNLGGVNLFIDYTAGDGNDIALTTVPEPTSLALLGLGGLLIARRRR
ncbi:MAG: autotransporter-associated beta strand repeat-containing protein [Planctomycetota bacterium]